ncbi:hypothetical protein HerbRD11066_29640 [Herbidospora sp. RD11066]
MFLTSDSFPLNIPAPASNTSQIANVSHARFILRSSVKAKGP